MHSDPGPTHVAVAGIFIALGLGFLTLATAIALNQDDWCTASVATFIVASIISIGLGSYMAAAVYFPLPLPRTRADRMTAPDLHLTTMSVVESSANVSILQIGFINEGRGAVEDATINVLVPDSVLEIRRCDAQGNALDTNGSIAKTSEPIEAGASGGCIYWQETGLRFPGRVASPIYFRVVFPSAPVPDLGVILRLTSPQLPRGFEVHSWFLV